MQTWMVGLKSGSIDISGMVAGEKADDGMMLDLELEECGKSHLTVISMK